MAFSLLINEPIPRIPTEKPPDRQQSWAAILVPAKEKAAIATALNYKIKSRVCPDALNFSSRQVTLCTCGLVTEIERCGRELHIPLAERYPGKYPPYIKDLRVCESRSFW